MERDTILGIMLLVTISSTLNSALNLPLVRAQSPPLYIYQDFKLTSNITFLSDGLVVGADGIVIDGAGYWLIGSGASGCSGISLYNRSGVTIKNIGVRAFDYGIRLNYSSFNSIYEDRAVENNIGIAVMDFSDYNRVRDNNATTNDRTGILLHYCSYNDVIANNVTVNGLYGIELVSSNVTSITGNNSTANYVSGIAFYLSSNNSIYRNSISNNYDGIRIYNSSFNNVILNNMTENGRYGIYFRYSSNNTIYHNNFINNVVQQAFCNNSINVWDNGYPSGGNYWSDYGGLLTELYYDNGLPEQGTAWTGAGGMFAVRFTPPFTGRLAGCSFYIVSEPAAVKVHLLNADRGDTITPFSVTMTGLGWCYSDLSGYRVTVSQGVDYYIAIEWTTAYKPYLGYESSGPDGRSWEYNGVMWTQETTRDYLMRTVVETGIDLKRGRNQDMAGSDGIGDLPYGILDNNLDRYPLINARTINIIKSPIELPGNSTLPGGDIFFEYGGFIIGANDTILNLNGSRIIGSGKGCGISVEASRVTVENGEIMFFETGISVRGSNNNAVGNNITNNKYGIYLWSTSNNSIVGNNITNNEGGIALDSSSYNTLSENNVRENWIGIMAMNYSKYDGIDKNIVTKNGRCGIYLFASSRNNVTANNCTANGRDGIVFDKSPENYVTANNVTENTRYGMVFIESSNNIIYHNNLIENARQVYDLSWDNPSYSPSTSVWNDGYPSGGNYWSDYTGVDDSSGPNQDLSGSDGIGDTPYAIDVNNRDNYPLMVQWETTLYDDWPMFRHDAQHTGYSTSRAPDSNSTMWTYSPSGYFAIADGMVFIASGNTPRALNVTTGQLIWSTQTPFTTGGITVGYSTVFIQDLNGILYALDEYAGTLKWNFTVGTGGRPTVADGMIFASTREQGTVYALDATAGALRWSRSLGYTVYSNPAIDSGIVFVATWIEGKVYALNESTGSTIWSSVTLTSLLEASPIIVDEKIYMGGGDGVIYVLNKNTGTLARTYGPVGGYLNEGPVVAYGKLFISTDDSDRTVYAIEEATGEILWSYYIGGGWGAIAGPNVADSKVFVASNSIPPMLFALNEATGQLIWSYSGSTTELTSDLVIANSMAFASIGNTLYAFGPRLRLPGDVNDDGTVDIFDAILLGGAFGSGPGDLNWDPDADLNSDNIVDIFDALLLALNLGRTA